MAPTAVSAAAFQTFSPLHTSRRYHAASLPVQTHSSCPVVPTRASAASHPKGAGLSRRAFLTLIAGTTAGASVLSGDLLTTLYNPGHAYGQSAAAAAAPAAPSGPFSLPTLPYAYNALEPHISEQIMRYHHDTHFNTYVKNLNAAVGVLGSSGPTTDAELKAQLANLDKIREVGTRTKLRNNGGGYLNHKQFFAQLSGNARALPQDAELAVAVERTFGSMEAFKDKFLGAATSLFGSGFTWLVRGADGKVDIVQTANQDNPVMMGMTPILACDCWEHAWYSQYGPKKAGYLPAWWKVIDWPVVNETFVAAAHDL